MNKTAAIYCPLPRGLRTSLRRGRHRVTNIGLERYCCGCDDYWPADTEFFYPAKNTASGLHTWCKACYAEAAARRRSGQQAAGATPQAVAS